MWVPKAVAALALGMLVSTSALHAQGAEFSLGGGVDLPLGDFDDVAKLGFHGLAGVSVVPAGSACVSGARTCGPGARWAWPRPPHSRWSRT